MDFNLSDMQRMLLDSAEGVIGDRYSLEHRRAVKQTDAGIDADAWASFAELGWLALAIPEERGGLGGDLADVAVLMTAFGGKLVAEPYVSSAVLAPAILAAADARVTDDVLAGIAGGAARVALAHGEPGDRGGIGPRRTTLTAAGNGYRLSGQKMLVLDAASADRLIVSAELEGEGLALVLVEAGAKGVASQAYPLIDGTRAADIRLDDVAVAPEAILLRGEPAAAALDEAIDRATVALMAQAVGSMEACLAICSAYLKERQQFGQPIGRFQSLQHIMADMLVAAHQARSALYQAMARVADAPVARARAVSLARITIGEAAQIVSRGAVQLHGGYGVTDEYEVSHHYRRLLTLEKMYGDIDHHVRRLASLPEA